MKKFFIVFLTFIIAFSFVTLPASAASSNKIYFPYTDEYFGNWTNFIFYNGDSSIDFGLNRGPFWTTSIRPGYLTYCSGQFDSRLDNEFVFMVCPAYRYDKDISPSLNKVYVNAGDYFSINADLVLYSKSKAVFDSIKVKVQTMNDNGDSYVLESEYYPLRDLSENGFGEQLVIDYSSTINTTGLPPNSYIYILRFEVAIGNTKNASAYSSSAFGFGMFSPGLGMYIGNKENAPIYDPPSRDAIDEEQQLMTNIENSLEPGTNEVEDLFSNYDSLFGESGHIYKGLLSASNMVSSWLGIDFISPVVTFSLLLGIFSFLLGSAFLITRSLKSSNPKKTENKSNYKHSGG